jgi:hypothetical protein
MEVGGCRDLEWMNEVRVETAELGSTYAISTVRSEAFARVMEEGGLRDPEVERRGEGEGDGVGCSPVLMFMHYVLYCVVSILNHPIGGTWADAEGLLTEMFGLEIVPKI